MPQAIKVDASGLILPHRRPSCSTMFHLVLTVLRVLGSGFQPRRHLLLENLALRHQLSVLQRSVPKPRLRIADRFLWVLPQQFWSGCHPLLVLVQPQTVVGWHRPGFRLFRRWKSRARSGRPSVDRQLIRLIRQMWSSNATWGSKRIQAELAKLGIQVSASTIRKYRLKGHRCGKAQTWTTFLHNHAEDLIAVSFLERITTDRSLPVPHPAPLSAAGSGQHLWPGICAPRRRLGSGTKAHRLSCALAESLCRAPDRIQPARVFGPRNRVQRAAPAPTLGG